MKGILQWIRKRSDILIYLFFGGLTTLVNLLGYFQLYNWLHISGAISNGISWVVAVGFAYLTNKPYVFKSHDWSRKTVVPELTKFVGCRVGSGVIETLLILVTVDNLAWNGNIMKIIASVFVVIANYIASKWFVFSKKEKG